MLRRRNLFYLIGSLQQKFVQVTRLFVVLCIASYLRGLFVEALQQQPKAQRNVFDWIPILGCCSCPACKRYGVPPPGQQHQEQQQQQGEQRHGRGGATGFQRASGAGWRTGAGDQQQHQQDSQEPDQWRPWRPQRGRAGRCT